MTFFEYSGAIKDIVFTTMKGMGITFKQLVQVTQKGAITIQYPEQRDQLPMGSRGLLFNDSSIASNQSNRHQPMMHRLPRRSRPALRAAISTARPGSRT